MSNRASTINFVEKGRDLEIKRSKTSQKETSKNLATWRAAQPLQRAARRVKSKTARRASAVARRASRKRKLENPQSLTRAPRMT